MEAQMMKEGKRERGRQRERERIMELHSQHGRSRTDNVWWLLTLRECTNFALVGASANLQQSITFSC